MSRRIFKCWKGHHMCSYVDRGSCWVVECRCELDKCEACK